MGSNIHTNDDSTEGMPISLARRLACMAWLPAPVAALGIANRMHVHDAEGFTGPSEMVKNLTGVNLAANRWEVIAANRQLLDGGEEAMGNRINRRREEAVSQATTCDTWTSMDSDAQGKVMTKVAPQPGALCTVSVP